MSAANAQWRLAARPVGLPKRSDWDYVEEPTPEPGEGQLRVKLEYLSLDPAMRGWMNAGRSYVPPVGIGEVMRAGGLGRVVESRHPDHAVDARVVICGAISQYNAEQAPRGPANYMQLLVERASMTGFLVFDFAARYDEAVAQLADWLQAGQLRSREDLVRGGLEQFPAVFLRLFRGENIGKLILELTD